MSSLLTGVTSRDGQGHILITIGVTPPHHYANGLPYEADGSLCGENSGPDYHHQGIPFTSNGRLSMAGGAPVRFNNGAMPLTGANRLSAGILPIHHVSSGVAYNTLSKVIFDQPV